MIKYVVLFLLIFASPSDAQSEAGRVWTRIEKPTRLEINAIRQVGAPVPASVRRYYRADDKNGAALNFENEAIYAVRDGLIEGLYVDVSIRFRDGPAGFSLDYRYSVGTAMTNEGSFVKGIANGSLHSDFEYGTGEYGALTLKRDGKPILVRRVRVR